MNGSTRRSVLKSRAKPGAGALEPDTDIPQDGQVRDPDWYLPDLDELRNNGDVEIHVTKSPLFTKEEWRARHRDGRRPRAGNAGGWGKIPAGR